MSRTPVAAQEHLSLLQEQEGRMLGNAAEPGLSQISAPGYLHDRPVNAEQEESLSQQRQHSAQQKAALAQAAAKMAEDAASMAGKAAEMARQAAEMAARAADQPWDGPSIPGVHQLFDMFPSPESSYFASIPPQPPRQIDQPMESYQSQFPAAEGPKRKRKSRASAQEASGSSSRPVAAIAPSPAAQHDGPVSHALSDYQTQLMLLEQQKQKRALLEPQKRPKRGQGSGSPGAPAVAFNAAGAAPGPGFIQGPEGGNDYQYQLLLLEQTNKKRAQERARLQQQIEEGSGSGGAETGDAGVRT